ncbi:MAG TPA: NAD(P)-dependent oxidoreductase, partial [Steroidobacteraceae bacterium]|nr:NAD(P)-dependent oxidoreductase [Steroidobacteraceae bacterium]
MDYLPVFLRLEDRHVVVVGGGEVALRKAQWLLKAGARVTVVAPQLHAALGQYALDAALTHRAGTFRADDLTGAAAVVAATGERAVNAAVSAAAQARGIPVNVVDDAELSTFIFPAIIDRSPLIVAVSSAGHAPVLARRVREQIEALLPQRLGALARFMGRNRQRVQAALQAAGRRAFWERIVGGPVATQVLRGDEAAAREGLRRELRTSQLLTPAARAGAALGEVYLIGAGPGDPDLLTLRALQLLQQADVILYDRLVSEAVLERARRDARRIFVGKESGARGQQEKIHALLLELTARGQRVARLKGGDPFVFGRGGEE